MKHELKILPQYFEAILSGDKSFEVRSIVDRTFNAGDELRLREFGPTGYSGREVTVKVTYLLNGIIFKGCPAVVMSIEVMDERSRVIKKLLGGGLLDDRDMLFKRGV